MRLELAIVNEIVMREQTLRMVREVVDAVSADVERWQGYKRSFLKTKRRGRKPLPENVATYDATTRRIVARQDALRELLANLIGLSARVVLGVDAWRRLRHVSGGAGPERHAFGKAAERLAALEGAADGRAGAAARKGGGGVSPAAVAAELSGAVAAAVPFVWQGQNYVRGMMRDTAFLDKVGISP